MYVTQAEFVRHMNRNVEDANEILAVLRKRLDALEAKPEPQAVNNRIGELEAEVTRWKSLHADMVTRCRALRYRPDIPVERIEAVDKLAVRADIAEARVRELEATVSELKQDNGYQWNELKKARATIARMTPVVEAVRRYIRPNDFYPITALRDAYQAYKESSNA